MTHTEHVHLLFGIGLAMTGVLWLGAQAYPAGPQRFVWPLLLFAVGFFLVIPTETQERTYVQVDAWDTFLSVFPDSLSVWLRTVQKAHVIQHKIAGVCAMLAGGIEGSRAKYGDLIERARMRAAEMGADAIIVTRDPATRSTGFAYVPPQKKKTGQLVLATSRTIETPRIQVTAIAWKDGLTKVVANP